MKPTEFFVVLNKHEFELIICNETNCLPRCTEQEYFDARLTKLDEDHCAILKATNHGIEKEAQLVVVSPLTRAIQTALLTIDQVHDR